MKLAEVVTLYEDNASNIAAMLRQAAGNIETETDQDDRTKAMVGVQITEGGQVEIYGWGAIDSTQCIAWLQMALVRMTLRQLGE